MAHETFADELRAAVAGDKHTIYTELMLQAAELLDEKMYRPTPVASVSPDATGKCGELVTVAYRHPTAHWAHHSGKEILPHCQKGEYPEPLVTRSQAEELLAAERAENEKLEAAWLEAEGIISDLKADNAALTARVKELEEINANLMGDDEDKPRYTTKRLKLEISRATEALQAKLAAAEKALTEIASFTQTTDLLWWQERARAVLGGKPS